MPFFVYRNKKIEVEVVDSGEKLDFVEFIQAVLKFNNNENKEKTDKKDCSLKKN